MLKRVRVEQFLLFIAILLAVISVNSGLSYGADDRTINGLKEKLITANKILDMEEIIRPQGHISVRIPGTDTFLITRAIAPGMATIDDIVVVNALDAKVISGKYTLTFGEVLAHAAIYQKRKDVNSVAHTHSLYVRVLSITETPLLPVSFEVMKVSYEPEKNRALQVNMAPFKRIPESMF